MTNEEKLKLCIVPSNEIRIVSHCNGRKDFDHTKMQQRHYDYDGRYFVWRDVKIVELSFDDLGNGYSFN
jgi:hypothetical protein